LFVQLQQAFEGPLDAREGLHVVGTNGCLIDVGCGFGVFQLSELTLQLSQEVFLRVFRGLDGFKGESKFSTWLYRVTWNLCADWLRRNRRPDRRAAMVAEADSLPDRRVNLEEGFLEEEQRGEVRRAMGKLDERYRGVVNLHYYQKLSYDQIAFVLDMPVKTVETRLYRARKMLRESLESSGQGGDE